MKFKLDFSVDKNGIELSHKDSIVSLGSCFADEMGARLISSGFKLNSNPFGTLFHPLAIMNTLNDTLSDKKEVNILKRSDLYFSWEASGKLFGTSNNELEDRILATRSKLKQNIKAADLLILTLGTAWGYRNKDLNLVVGNCHKEPLTSFSKELSSIDLMVKECQATIEKVRALNPAIKILVTVSPVRHKKDGLIENNRSKARLLELTHRLVEESGCIYFPSYEIVIDELRDYRFFKNDLVHPSEEAVNYVWKQFQETSIKKSTIEIIAAYQKITRALAHRSLFPNSEEDHSRIQKNEEKKRAFISKYPEVNWD